MPPTADIAPDTVTFAAPPGGSARCGSDVTELPSVCDRTGAFAFTRPTGTERVDWPPGGGAGFAAAGTVDNIDATRDSVTADAGVVEARVSQRRLDEPADTGNAPAAASTQDDDIHAPVTHRDMAVADSTGA